MDSNTWLCVSLRRLRWTPKASLPAERKGCLFVAACSGEIFYSMAATINEVRRKQLQAIMKVTLFLCWAFSLKYRSQPHVPEWRARFCFLRLHHLRHSTFASSLFSFVLLHAIMADHRYTFHQHIWQRIILITYIIGNIYYTLLVISKKTPPNMLYSVSVFIAMFF